MVGKLSLIHIYLLMGNVHVAAGYHGLFGIQFEQVCAEIVLPFHAVIEASQSSLRIGGVYAYQEDVSYTHLAVYKRQEYRRMGAPRNAYDGEYVEYALDIDCLLYTSR